MSTKVDNVSTKVDNLSNTFTESKSIWETMRDTLVAIKDAILHPVDTFKEALQVLFVPSQEALDWSDLKSILESKFPFDLVSSIQSSLNVQVGSATPVWTLDVFGSSLVIDLSSISSYIPWLRDFVTGFLFLVLVLAVLSWIRPVLKI